MDAIVDLTPPQPIAAVLLAAGEGQRFHGPTHKLLAPLDGRPVWHHALDGARGAAASFLVVVTGAVALALPDDVVEVHNPRWRNGQASSLWAALQWARANGVQAIVVGLADQPFIPRETWARVATAAARTPIVAARYGEAAGPHPVRLDASVWDELTSEGDRGAGPLMRRHPEWVTWVDCVGSMFDIDTQEDLSRWTT